MLGQIIAFWEEYVDPFVSAVGCHRVSNSDQERAPDDEGRCRYLEHHFLATYLYSHIVLLRPSMVFLLMQTPDPTTIKVHPTYLASPLAAR
jgi:hypothetical protein